MKLELLVNGAPHELEARADESLLVVIRRELGLASVRETCGIGVCGACTVLVDGLPVGLPVARAARTGREIGPSSRSAATTSAAGLCGDHAFQCGYCTPGMVLAARQLLEENRARPRGRPTQARGNLVQFLRQIVEAVLLAAGRRAMDELSRFRLDGRALWSQAVKRDRRADLRGARRRERTSRSSATRVACRGARGGGAGGNAGAHGGGRDEEADADRVVDETVAAFGRLDVLINGVGGGAGALSRDAEVYPEDVWDWMIDLNLRSQFLVSKAAARAMIAAGNGGES